MTKFRPNSEGIGGDVEAPLPADDRKVVSESRFRYFVSEWFEEPLNRDSARSAADVALSALWRAGRGEAEGVADFRERWALWFVQCADESTELSDGERDGLRVAAAHLRNVDVAEQVAAINLGPTVVEVVRQSPNELHRTTFEETS